MASSADSWMREFNEASKLADEVSSMISAKSSLPSSGPESQRHLSAARRKITILRTRLDTLQSLLQTLPSKQPLSKKEMKRRHDMLDNMITKANQMASTLNMNNLANRDSLLGPETKRPDVISRATGLDNQDLVGFQRQVIKEQDEDLDKLEETVVSTKHVALAINEELNLHTALLDNLDYHVDTTNSRLQRVQRKLAFLNKRTKGGCTWLCLLIIFIVILAVAIFLLKKENSAMDIPVVIVRETSLVNTSSL